MDKVTISNLQGESGLVNVVRFFVNNGVEYLIYSLNEVDESGYTRLYVAKVSGVDGNYTADTLNETEWAEIKNLVKVIVKANKENLPVPVQDINPSKIKNIVLKDKKIFKLNTPLVNDLSANKPKFNDDESSGNQKNVFETQTESAFNTTSFNQPVQPTFEMPSTPSFDQPVQPTFEMPSTPSFDQPAQPTFEMPSTTSFDQPVQPTFEMPSTPSFSANNNLNTPNFDFSSTNNFENTSNIGENYQEKYEEEKNKNEQMQNQIDKLNEEIDRYKSIIDSVKNLIEK